MLDQYSSDNVLVDVDTEDVGNLLSDMTVAPSRIAPFHLDDRRYQLSRRAFRSGSPVSFGGEEQLVFRFFKAV